MALFDPSSWFGKPKTNVTQTTQNNLGPEQKSIFDLAFPYAQQAAKQAPQTYQGPQIAGFAPDELQAQAMYRANAGGVTQNLANQGANAQTSLLKGFDPNDPTIQNMIHGIMEGTTRNLNENILPGVRSGAIQGGGMFSGGNSRAGIAEGKAIGDTNLNLSKTIADSLFGAWNSASQRQQSAVGMNPSVMDQQNQPANMLGAVGGQNRAMDQAQIDKLISSFNLQQQLPYLKAKELMDLINGMPGGSTTSNVQGTPNSQSPLTSILGAAAAGAAKAAGS